MLIKTQDLVGVYYTSLLFKVLCLKN